MGITNFNVDRMSTHKYQIISYAVNAVAADVASMPIGAVGPLSGGVVKKVRATAFEETSGTLAITMKKLSTTAASQTETAIAAAITLNGDNTWVEGAVVEAAKHVDAGQIITFRADETSWVGTGVLVEVWIESYY